MRILIYGAGAVGCFLGGHLALAQHEVTLLGRTWLKDAIDSRGLSIKLASGQTRRVSTIQVITKPQEIESFDLILFSMKANDTVRAIQELIEYLTRDSEMGVFGEIPPPPPIVCFQNGVGNEESLRSAFGPDAVAAASVATPVSMPEPAIVLEEKQRGVAIAEDSVNSQTVIDAFHKTDLVLQPVASSTSLKWSKLLTNMVGNSVSAIVDRTPDQVYSDPALFDIERRAFLEALGVLRLAQIDLVNLPGLPVKLLATAFELLPKAISKPVLTQQIGKGRGDKLPSLQLDLRNQKTVTEVEWLNGAVVKLADDMNRYAPVNHVLALTLADIASGRVPWQIYQQNPDLLVTAIRSATRKPLQ